MIFSQKESMSMERSFLKLTTFFAKQLFSNVSLYSERKRHSSNEILRKTLAILYNFMETRKMFFFKGRLLSCFTRKIRLIVIRMSMTKQKILSHTGYFFLQNFNNIPVSSPQTDNLSFIFTWHLDDNC